jgi:hypothetical protein
MCGTILHSSTCFDDVILNEAEGKLYLYEQFRAVKVSGDCDPREKSMLKKFIKIEIG